MNLCLKQKNLGICTSVRSNRSVCNEGEIAENGCLVFGNPAHSPDITVIRRFRQRGPVLRTCCICVVKIAVSRA